MDIKEKEGMDDDQTPDGDNSERDESIPLIYYIIPIILILLSLFVIMFIWVRWRFMEGYEE